MSYYSDEELRMHVLPLAITLVNTEVQRVMQRCNTQAIAAVTGELVNIVKYGTPEQPSIEAEDVAPVYSEQPVEPEQMKYA